MRTAERCPEPDELRLLLENSLSGDRQQECIEHLDNCPCCQSRIEEIATEGTGLSEVVEQIRGSDPVETSAYWPALKAMEVGAAPVSPLPATMPRTAEPRREAALHFLEPSTDGAYLGRLGHFDVMRVIGRGGMGIVLEAFDSMLRRNVAIKVLDPDLANDEVARQRFCREARAAASVTHENVVAVHHVEKLGDGKLPLLVMQLVGGESLDKRLAREKRLPFREVVRIGMQAAHGLAAAHAQGLIHRDIKPGNILLEPPTDRVKLTDFGLARVAEDVKLTRSGFVSGTPLYMAPEQAMGEEPDPRSDLFSLGSVLYEMCAGQAPFSGNSALAILKQIAEVKHRPLRELNPQVPDWLATTIDRLLAKKPADRIQTAAQLAELLEFEWALMKTTSEDVPTVCQIEQRRITIRNRWIAAIVGTVFLAAGLVGGSWLSHREGTVPAEVSTAPPVAVLSANAGAIWSVAFDPTSKTVAMAVEDGSLRLWDLPTQSVKETLHAHRGNIWSTSFVPSSDLFATAGDDGLLKLWQPAHTEPVRIFQHDNAIRGVAFTRDGQRVYVGDRGGEVRIWSRESEKPLAETQQPGAVYAVALSPNDETLATAGSDKVVHLWNAKTLSPRLQLEGHAGPVFGLSFHRDGKKLASAGWDNTVRIWDAGSGQLIKSWEAKRSRDEKGGDIWGIAFSPDGSKLATGGTDGAVRLWNSESGEPLASYFGHKTGIHTIAFNSDGSLIASGGRDGAVRVWKVE